MANSLTFRDVLRVIPVGYATLFVWFMADAAIFGQATDASKISLVETASRALAHSWDLGTIVCLPLLVVWFAVTSACLGRFQIRSAATISSSGILVIFLLPAVLNAGRVSQIIDFVVILVSAGGLTWLAFSFRKIEDRP